MYHPLFNCFSECLNGEYLPASFKLDQMDGEVGLELLLFIRGDAINLYLQLDSDTLRISQGPGRVFRLSTR
jgi:hypothetical protein